MSNIIYFPDMQFEHEQTNEWKAQDLVYDAWEIDSTVQRKRLARKALELDPLCAGAYTILKKTLVLSGDYLKQDHLCDFLQVMDNYYGTQKNTTKQLKYIQEMLLLLCHIMGYCSQ